MAISSLVFICFHLLLKFIVGDETAPQWKHAGSVFPGYFPPVCICYKVLPARIR